MASKYDSKSGQYNRTRCADPFLTKEFIRLLQAKPRDSILDIGCGTGNYTHELSKEGYTMIGVDPSSGMLKEARARNPEIKWLKGSAESIPCKNGVADRIIGSLTIHHWENMGLGFNELSRVLRNNGRLVLFTSTPNQMNGYWLNHYFPTMMENSKKQMPSYDLVFQNLKAAGFDSIITEKYFVQEGLKDQFLYSGKNNPGFYFVEKFQEGISSFTHLSHKAEIKTGLEKLHDDIQSGEFLDVKKAYENELGDYLFVVAEKTKEETSVE